MNEAGLVISTAIVIVILSLLMVILLLWSFKTYSKDFNLITAAGIGVSIGLFLAGLFLYWVIVTQPLGR